MKKILVLGVVGFLSVLLASAAFAAAPQGTGWMLGLRVGPSIPTGKGHLSLTDTDGSSGRGKLKAKTGPVVNGQVAYWFNQTVGLGLSGDWETHSLGTKCMFLDRSPGDLCSDSDGEFTKVGGRIYTISLMPTVMVRPFTSGSFAPYLSFGIGANVNWIKKAPSDQVGTQINNVSFAVKPAIGFDWFVTPNWALNAEVGWKLNRITGLKTLQAVHDFCDTCTPEIGFGRGKLDASAVSILFGARWYSN